MNNEKTYSKPLTAYKPSEYKRSAYKFSLPLLINDEIYPNLPKAKMGAWKLGTLHSEWNDILNRYNGIMIKAPRDHLKTFFFFEANALRLCDEYPDIEIQYYTSTDPLAIKKLNNVKRLAKVPRFRHLLAGADINNKTELQFGNGSKIYVQGFNSKGRGGHPDVVILDDIIDIQVMYSAEMNEKTKERLAMEILPMLNPDGKIYIIGTVQREDDIYSIDLSDIEVGGKKMSWFIKTYDAIVDEEKQITLYPEKWSWEALMTKKAEIIKFSGERFFDKEYRNLPVNVSGEVIKPEWKKEYDELPAGLSVYSGWDLSVGKNLKNGDFTAKCSIALNIEEELPKIYIKSVYFERIDFPNRVKQVILQGEEENPVAIGVEDNNFQTDTVQTAKKNSNLNIVGITSTENKLEKFVQMISPLAENGRLLFKRGDAKQQQFWEQLTSLPRGAHDDICDAFCNALKAIPKNLYSRSKDFLLVI